MNKLKCSAVNCLYNYDALCSAETIKVQGEQAMGSGATFCGTFSSKSIGNYVSSITNMNYGGAAKQLFNTAAMDPTFYVMRLTVSIMQISYAMPKMFKFKMKFQQLQNKQSVKRFIHANLMTNVMV